MESALPQRAPRSATETTLPSRDMLRRLTLDPRQTKSKMESLDDSLVNDRSDRELPSVTQCRVDTLQQLPILVMPITDSVLPVRAHARSDTPEDRYTASSTESAPPMRLRVRRDIVLPKWTCDKMLIRPPTLPAPRRDRVDPTRQNERVESVLPSVRQSRTDSFEPLVTIRRTEMLLPSETKFSRDVVCQPREFTEPRRETELPRQTKLMMDSWPSILAKERRDTVDASWAKPITDTFWHEPQDSSPTTEQPLPTRRKERIERLLPSVEKLRHERRDPLRTICRTDKVDPKPVKLMMLSFRQEPVLCRMPCAESDEPHRTNERTLRLDPRCDISRTESLSPSRAMLRSDMELPSVTCCSTDIEFWITVLASTDIPLPMRDSPRSDSPLPSCTKLRQL
mmetsp:Transcript_12976/g.31663  ORF Transcript_12976/g.31663 Transcript_12976/m.31663 type:complete len:397 (+) Transcript_12976:6638-7828(+)